MKEPAKKVRQIPVGDDHAVIRLTGGGGGHRNTPCAQCPWRLDATGVFPAEAFVVSAPTSYDHGSESFGCHESSHEHPQTCAGFLLRGADDNLNVRFRASEGRIHYDRLDDGGLHLYASYREMAIGNGVDPQDPALERCEPEHKEQELRARHQALRRRRDEAQNS